MNELIKITTNEEGKKLVSARELHEFLESKERFSKWWNKVCDNEDYGFEENIDYTLYQMVHPENNQEICDYVITIDMAKEISMISRLPKGKQARKYFIQCEKQLKEVNLKANLLLDLYNGGENAITAAQKLKELELQPVLKELEEQKPKADYYDNVLNAENLLTTSDIAKDLGMSAIRLNKILNGLKIQFKRGKKWELYSDYLFLITDGCADYKIDAIDKPDGSKISVQGLKWTEKGRKWIIKTLKNSGIIV